MADITKGRAGRRRQASKRERELSKPAAAPTKRAAEPDAVRVRVLAERLTAGIRELAIVSRELHALPEASVAGLRTVKLTPVDLLGPEASDPALALEGAKALASVTASAFELVAKDMVGFRAGRRCTDMAEQIREDLRRYFSRESWT